MLNFKNTFLISFLLINFTAIAQNMAAFIDRRNHFYIYNNGALHKQEFLPIGFYRVGGNCVIYDNRRGETVLYGNNGETHKFTTFGSPDDMYFTENYMLTRMAGLLTILTPEKAKTLGLRNRIEVVGGNLSIDVYNKTTLKFETRTLNESNFDYGDLIVAYVDYDDRFKIFEQGKINEVEFDPPLSFATSDVMVAYIDETDQLKLYNNGATNVVYNDYVEFRVGNSYLFFIDNSNQLVYVNPNTLKQHVLLQDDVIDFVVGDNSFAIVDDYDSFYVFENEKLIQLFDYIPDNYAYYGDMLYYEDAQGISHIRYKGEDIPLEVYPLNRVQFYDNIIAYLDRDGYLKGVYEGKPFHLTNEITYDFDIQFRVIVYQTGNQDFHIYHDGQVVF